MVVMLKDININQIRIPRKRNLESIIKSTEIERIKEGKFRSCPIVYEMKKGRFRIIDGVYICQLVKAAGYQTITCEVVDRKYLEQGKLMRKRKNKKKPNWDRWKLEIEGLRMMTKDFKGGYREMTNILVKVYSEKKNNKNWWR